VSDFPGSVRAELGMDRWARFGQAVYGDHRLNPAPLAALGMVTVCTCGQSDVTCPVRHFVRTFELEDLSPARWV
jgi:hypothetical protein